MAQINIVQPSIGRIVVDNPDPSNYTVRWVSDGSMTPFHGMRLFCEACNNNLVYKQQNPATFNTTELEASGHPGPFDISAIIGEVVVMAKVGTGVGTATPEFWVSDMPSSGSATCPIYATPGDGYEFIGWNYDPNDTESFISTNRSVNLIITQPCEIIVYAHFRVKRYKVYTKGQGALDTTEDKRIYAPSTETSPLTVYYRPRGSSSSTDQIAVALIEGAGEYEYQQSVTIRVTITNDLSGRLKYVGMYATAGLWSEGSDQPTMVFDMPNRQVSVLVSFTIDGIEVTLCVKTKRSKVIVMASADDGKSIKQVAYKDYEDYRGSSYWVKYAVALNTRIHCKAAKTVIQEPWTIFHGWKPAPISETGSGLWQEAWYDITEPVDITVAFCSHLLLCEDPDLLYDGSTNSLMYDCYAN